MSFRGLVRASFPFESTDQTDSFRITLGIICMRNKIEIICLNFRGFARMSCLLPFFAVVYICLAFCSRSDRNGPKTKRGSVLKLGRHNMKEMNLIDDLPYQEELVIDGEAVNYSLGMMILQYFQEIYEQKLFMNIIRAYKTELLTPDEVKRKCRVFLSSFTRAHCQNLAEMY